jgi:hypothetical protein
MESTKPPNRVIEIIQPEIESANPFLFNETDVDEDDAVHSYLIGNDCDNITNKLINKLSPLLVDSKLKKAKPGIYVWLMKEDENDTNITHLYAKRALIPQEIQTKHLNILIELNGYKINGTSNVLCAGEFVLDGDKLTFNYQSGTIMQTGAWMTPENTNYVIDIFRKYVKKGITIESNDAILILDENTIPMNNDMLKTIRKMCPNNVYKFPFIERFRSNSLKGFIEQNKYLLQQQQRKMSELRLKATDKEQELLNKKPVDILKYDKYLIDKRKKAGGSKKKTRTRLCCRKTKRRVRGVK